MIRCASFQGSVGPRKPSGPPTAAPEVAVLLVLVLVLVLVAELHKDVARTVLMQLQ